MTNFISTINNVLIYLGCLMKGGKLGLNAFESNFFKKLFLILEEKDRNVLMSQLSELNYLQRVMFRELDFYKIGFGYINSFRYQKFECNTKSIAGHIIVGSERNKFSLNIIDGNFFSIEFQKSIKDYGAKDFSIELDKGGRQ
jgi:hypothetical protein